MATITHSVRMTLDEYLANRDLPKGTELVDGLVELVSPVPAARHGWIVQNIHDALGDFVRPRALGRIFGDNFGYELPHRPDTIRVPDVSFVRAGRIPKPLSPRHPLRLAPDLVVEVLSDSDTRAALRRKLADYTEAGVPLLWFVDPDERGVEVHAAARAMRWVGEELALDGGDVLPGLSVPVAELFRGVDA